MVSCLGRTMGTTDIKIIWSGGTGADKMDQKEKEKRRGRGRGRGRGHGRGRKGHQTAVFKRLAAGWADVYKCMH